MFDMYEHSYEYKRAFVVDKCGPCGRDIYTSEEYYDFDGEIVCEDCIYKYLTEHKKEAEEDDN